MKNKNTVQGLGAALIDKKTYLFFCNDNDIRHGTFTVRESDNGLTFTTMEGSAKVINMSGPSDELGECSFVHISKDGKYYYLTYQMCDSDKLCIAQSTNLIDWEKKTSLDIECNNAKIVSNYLYAGRNVIVTGGEALRLYVSRDFDTWTRVKKDLLLLDKEADELIVIDVQVVDEGIFVIYANSYIEKVVATVKTQKKDNQDKKKEKNDEVVQYKLYGALFDYGDPTRMLWQSKRPIYETKNTLDNSSKLFGAVLFEDYFVSYWTNDDGEMFLIRHFYSHEDDVAVDGGDESRAESKNDEDTVTEEFFELERAIENPIMSPQDHYSWESQAAYNPTAIEDDGTIHIIYRADGDDMMSVWGYASTKDGITIDNRSKHCIYHRRADPVQMPFPAPTLYTSGNNGNGGCEDPRAVLIDGMVYVTFTAFDGWGSVRVALTSIALEDLKNQKWNWNQTRQISPPGEMNKNWVIFPEKIGGKFAILHSFVPNILVDYFDSLDELDGKNFISSNNVRPIDYSRGWDSWFRGVGPAPLKTDDGWLIIYHAMDHTSPDRYRLGALLLDLEDPTKELCRSRGPILEPAEHYENNGHKWGVIYSCGAVIKNDQLFVYYGGADKFVCVATAPLQQFLDDLKGTGEVKMIIS
ncbi:MAG: hypothetical protein U9Q12_02125 [Patescibacteria group bacterium]|nr:hypothetical protein [Patescibacteria group bacterium]